MPPLAMIVLFGGIICLLVYDIIFVITYADYLLLDFILFLFCMHCRLFLSSCFIPVSFFFLNKICNETVIFYLSFDIIPSKCLFLISNFNNSLFLNVVLLNDYDSNVNLVEMKCIFSIY